MAPFDQDDAVELPVLGIWGIPVSTIRTPANPLNSDISTEQTVEILIRLARASARSAIIHAVCESILSSCQSLSPNLPPDNKLLASQTFYWVKSHIQFVEDETLMRYGLGETELDKELLIPPITLLNMPQPMGDCDDFSLLTASILLAFGIHCSFITIAADPEDVEKFSHIYIKAYMDGDNGIYLDTSHGAYPGWEANIYTRKQEWLIA